MTVSAFWFIIYWGDIMPRGARKKSDNGTYHIMLRGINKQQIFEEREDYEKFLEVLKSCKAISEFKLYAYCLMGNHIHLLIKEGKEGLETIFKRIGGKFVYWYNVKYERVGHLFGDRFKSEPVDTDAYFLTVVRYIHRNPVKAGICKKPKEYPYSSYNDYLNDSDFVDRDLLYAFVSKEQFEEFNAKNTIETCLDLEEKKFVKVTDEQAIKIIHKIANCKNIAEFQHLEEKQRIKYVQKLKVKGLSVRQISRLTGTGKGLVEKWLKI